MPKIAFIGGNTAYTLVWIAREAVRRIANTCGDRKFALDKDAHDVRAVYSEPNLKGLDQSLEALAGMVADSRWSVMRRDIQPSQICNQLAAQSEMLGMSARVTQRDDGKLEIEVFGR